MKRLLLVFLFFIADTPSEAQHKKEILYVGTFSVRGSEGIYVLEFDPSSVSLSVVQTVAGPESPSYLDVHPSGKFIYSANRGSVDGISKQNASISSYSIDSHTGKLKFINSRPSFGLGSCHIAINPFGTFALVSQYQEGTLGGYPILIDGSIGPLTDSIRYTGKGKDLIRQESPHIHSSSFSLLNQFVYVADLGNDKIYSYRYTNNRLVLAEQSYIDTKPGTGPRHISFHPNGKYFYLAEELTSTVGTFALDQKGTVKIMSDQVVSLPESFSGTNLAADIHTSADGRFLYMSNRGADAIAIFRISGNGNPMLIGQQETMGKTPRSFAFNKSGEFMFVSNQDSDNIVVFRVDKKTGLLHQTGVALKMPSPVCIKVTP